MPHLHGSVRPAAEEPVVRVDEDLRDALADVLKDAVARVLVAERVIALVAVHGPDLKWESVRLIHDVLVSYVFESA